MCVDWAVKLLRYRLDHTHMVQCRWLQHGVLGFKIWAELLQIKKQTVETYEHDMFTGTVEA